MEPSTSVAEAVEARRKLERAILALLHDFSEHTGLAVRSVDVALLEERRIGLQPQHHVAGVTVEVRL